MKKDGLENVRKEPVMVPKWVRGRESLDLVEPVRQPLPILGLGNSVGTGPAGIEGDVIVVKDFDEMTARAADVKGRIVLFNAVVHQLWRHGRVPAAMARRARPRSARPRSSSAPSARPAFARPTPVRRCTPTMRRRFAAAAISAEDADRFQRLQDRGVRIRVRLSMEAHFDADTTVLQRGRRASRARVAERDRGRRRPLRFVGRRRPARATMAADAS